jgi:hypothetical protein
MLDSEKIKDFLENPKKEYKVFNLGFSKKEKEVFKNFKLPKLGFTQVDEIKLAKSLAYTFNGNIKDMKDMKDLKEFLSVLGDNSSEDIEILENKIKEIAKEVVTGFGKASPDDKFCWLNIRITYKDPFFNIPRWHHDGYAFESRGYKKGQASYVMAFQGPGTLLIKDTGKVIDKYNEIQKLKKPIKYGEPGWEKESMRIRKLEYKELKDVDKIQLTNNEGCVFFAYPGTDKKFKQGALHSEPKKDTFRMFMKIIPGTKKEINEQIEKYGSFYKEEKADWQKFKSLN